MDLPKHAKNAYNSAKSRANSSVKPTALLSKDEFVDLWVKADGRCQLSGLTFHDTPETYDSKTGFKRLTSFPWQPSLDQIIPGMGYARGNCQLLCKCVNIGKNSYSQDTFLKWVKAVTHHQEQRSSN